MEHPITGAGGLFPASSAGILDLDLDPSARRPLPPPAGHPMPLFRDDEDACSAGDESPNHDSAPRGTRKGAPWQRMKWTDDVVRLLISLVASIGEDAGATGKQCPALQRKGKWKMVSKMMMQNGIYASPQQCEDKFNDLNKRYKRLNEILGRGTSCQVVENPALLDSMHHVSQKGKEDVRRILSSKHLFYREMCAYHNGQRIPDAKIGFLKCGDAHEIVDDDEEDEDEKDEGGGDDDDDESDGVKSEEVSKIGHEKLQAEIDVVVHDSTKTLCERRVWIRKRLLQLQQESVGIQAEAYELEKQRMKWKRFCGKKDRELESLRMENEKLRLENERMTLQVRHKELQLDIMRPGETVEPSCCQVEGERARAQTGLEGHSNI